MTKPISMIPIEKIRLDLSPQARIAIDQAKVEEYTEALRNGESLPAVDAFGVEHPDGNYYLLGDGITRAKAHLAAGWAIISARLHDGGEEAAFRWALKANTNKTHGVVRTKADARNAVKLYLQRSDAKGPWYLHSDREIARACDVHHDTVATIAAELVRDGVIPERKERVGADGKTRSTPTNQLADPPVDERLDLLPAPKTSLPKGPAVKCHCGRLAFDGVHCMEHAAETKKSSLLISSPEQRAAISGPGLYDQAERQAAERKASLPSSQSPSVSAPQESPAKASELEQSVDAAFAKSGVLDPKTLLPASHKQSAGVEDSTPAKTNGGYQHYNSPKWLLDLIRKLSPIALDPFHNVWSLVGALLYFALEDDGMREDRNWAELTRGKGQTYANPPYENPLPVAHRFVLEARRGAEITACLPTSHSTEWYQLLRANCQAFATLNRKVDFGKEGVFEGTAFHESTLFYFGPQVKKFRALLESIDPKKNKPYGFVTDCAPYVVIDERQAELPILEAPPVKPLCDMCKAPIEDKWHYETSSHKEAIKQYLAKEKEENDRIEKQLDDADAAKEKPGDDEVDMAALKELVFAFLGSRPVSNLHDVLEATGVHIDHAKIVLMDLIKERKVTRDGERRGATYYVSTPPGAPPPPPYVPNVRTEESAKQAVAFEPEEPEDDDDGMFEREDEEEDEDCATCGVTLQNPASRSGGKAYCKKHQDDWQKKEPTPTEASDPGPWNKKSGPLSEVLHGALTAYPGRVRILFMGQEVSRAELLDKVYDETVKAKKEGDGWKLLTALNVKVCTLEIAPLTHDETIEPKKGQPLKVALPALASSMEAQGYSVTVSYPKYLRTPGEYYRWMVEETLEHHLDHQVQVAVTYDSAPLTEPHHQVDVLDQRQDLVCRVYADKDALTPQLLELLRATSREQAEELYEKIRDDKYKPESVESARCSAAWRDIVGRVKYADAKNVPAGVPKKNIAKPDGEAKLHKLLKDMGAEYQRNGYEVVVYQVGQQKTKSVLGAIASLKNQPVLAIAPEKDESMDAWVVRFETTDKKALCSLHAIKKEASPKAETKPLTWIDKGFAAMETLSDIGDAFKAYDQLIDKSKGKESDLKEIRERFDKLKKEKFNKVVAPKAPAPKRNKGKNEEKVSTKKKAGRR